MSVLSDAVRQKIRDLFPNYPNKRAITLPALHIVQEEMRAVSPPAMREIAELLELHPAEVHDTMSFYGFFKDQEHPLGKRRVWVCRSLPCMLRGGEELLKEISDRLGIGPGETTADGKVTLEFAECLGVCEGAPCVLVDDECHPCITGEKTAELLRKL